MDLCCHCTTSLSVVPNRDVCGVGHSWLTQEAGLCFVLFQFWGEVARGHLCFRAVCNFLTWSLYSNSPRLNYFSAQPQHKCFSTELIWQVIIWCTCQKKVVTRIVATYSVFVCFKYWDFMSSRSQPYLSKVFAICDHFPFLFPLCSAYSWNIVFASW
jgi:hypothetical protein